VPSLTVDPQPIWEALKKSALPKVPGDLSIRGKGSVAPPPLGPAYRAPFWRISLVFARYVLILSAYATEMGRTALARSTKRRLVLAPKEKGFDR
jgi:hypothetical protein